MDVNDILAQSAKKWPARAAIRDAVGTLDYATLFDQVEAMRAQLLRLGVAQGQGIGVMGRDSRAFVITAFAALGCGAVVMPMSHQLREAEIAEIQAAAPLHAILDDATGIRPVTGRTEEIAISGSKPMRFGWTGIERGKVLMDGFPGAAFVRFTSGTTGGSKGVVLTHEAVLERTAAANAGLGVTDRDAVLWVLPMAFHFFVSIVLYLRYGATILLTDDHLAEAMLDTANRHDATLVYASPMHYRMLLAAGGEKRFPPSLRLAISTSTGLSPHLAQDFNDRFGIPVSQAYGVIEVGLPMINLDRQIDKPESVGPPQPGYECAFLDENHQPVAEGEEGQLAIRGPGMFAGYLNPPSPSSGVLEGGWFVTGDLARRDAEGYVTVLGRCKSMIHVAGQKVFPEEVEAVLDTHPLVAQSRVSGRPHTRLGEVVHADVVLRNGAAPPDPEEIIAFCHAKLSALKVPQTIAFTNRLQRTRSGKVTRH